jgi:hypothetical protein
MIMDNCDINSVIKNAHSTSDELWFSLEERNNINSVLSVIEAYKCYKFKINGAFVEIDEGIIAGVVEYEVVFVNIERGDYPLVTCLYLTRSVNGDRADDWSKLWGGHITTFGATYIETMYDIKEIYNPDAVKFAKFLTI